MKLTVLAILIAAAAMGVALLLLSNGGIGSSRQMSDQREAMGTLVTIMVFHSDTQIAQDAIEAAFARLVEIESIASMQDEASEVSELNRMSYLPAASDELVEILRLSQIVNQVSDGAFDVSFGAILDLWNFKSSATTQFKDLDLDLQADAIAEAREHVGMDRILLGSGRKTSISLVPGTRVDLGGIAKGYAVDAAMDTLRESGIDHARVEAGDMMRVCGGMPDGSNWQIALSNPDEPSESATVFHLFDGAIATSGNYQRFFNRTNELEKIIDPRTGYPATVASSVTVIAPTCAEANALATAVFVLGAESGVALIEQLGRTETFILGFENPKDVHRSSGMATFEQSAKD